MTWSLTVTAPTARADSPVELAWAAGFYDGEGCATHNRRTYIRIQVTQLDRRPLYRFHAAVGGAGSIVGPDAKGLSRWQISGSGAEAVIATLEPYLSEPKREQIARVRALVASAPARGMHHANQWGPCTVRYETEEARREAQRCSQQRRYRRRKKMVTA